MAHRNLVTVVFGMRREQINQRHFRKKDQNKLVGMLLIF
jgi:hypothetical protein